MYAHVYIRIYVIYKKRVLVSLGTLLPSATDGQKAFSRCNLSAVSAGQPGTSGSTGCQYVTTKISPAP